MNINDLFTIKTLQVGPDLGKSTAAKVKPGGLSMRFTPGQLVQGKVVQTPGQGGLLLDIEGQTVSAESRVALKPGETLWLEVKQGGNKPWFVLAEKKAATLEAMRALLSDSPGLAKAFRGLSLLTGSLSSQPSALSPQLQALFQTFSALSLDGQPAPEAIMRLVAWMAGPGGGKRQSESLKPGGLDLTEVMKTAGNVNARALSPGMDSESLERLAGFLKSMGSVNEAPVSSDQEDFLLFPCFFCGEAGWGEWMFSLDREREESSKSPSYSLEFFLTMSHLGDVHIKTQLQDRTVRGEVGVGSDEVLSFLEKELPHLVEAIEALDFGPVQIQCCHSKKTHLQNVKETLEAKAGLQSSAIFHVTA